MTQIAPVAPSGLPVLSNLAASPAGQRLSAFVAQPAVRRSLPALIGISGVALAAVLWMAVTGPAQRVLYASLTDAERAQVVASLEGAGVPYTIDPAGGALTVAEADLYRARMVVASDGALTPDAGADLLDTIPLGSSRTLEAERLRMARERELMLTILEIDGVEAARVHLAVPERSTFVREQAPPTASVMLRLGRNRTLSPEQARSITSLVAAAVPGMPQDAVRLVNQHGQLLAAGDDIAAEATHQVFLERKLRTQIAQLLLPIFGDGNFTSEVQVQLSQEEVTRAEESFDKDGAALRSVDERQVQQAERANAEGVPGVLSNTPPADATLTGAGAEPDTQTGAIPLHEESSIKRAFEVGRRVSVTTQPPRALRRLSIAIAIDPDALAQAKPLSLEQVQSLVAAAAGADPQRGDQVVVYASSLRNEVVELPFWENKFFQQTITLALATLAALLFYLLVMRRLKKRAAVEEGEGTAGVDPLGDLAALPEQSSSEGAVLKEQVAYINNLAKNNTHDFLSLVRHSIK